MELHRRIFKGALWSTVGKWSDKLISTAVFFILARLLEVEDFGLVALATVILTFVETIVEQGFSQAIVQRQDIESKHLDTAFWCEVGMGLALTIVIILVAGPVAVLFKTPQLTPIIYWLSVSIVFKGLSSLQETILRRELDFKAISIRRVIGNLAGGTVGVSMALAGLGVWSLVGKQLVDVAIGVPLLWRVSAWRPKLAFSTAHLQELLIFQLNIIGLRLLTFLSQHSTNLLIGYFLGPIALGYYSIAHRLVALVLQVTTSATTEVMDSAFARLQQEKEHLQNSFYRTTEILSLINLPAFLGIALLAPEFVPIVFGEQWIASIPVIQILALVGIVESTTFINGSIIVAMGKPSWYLKIQFLGFLLSTIFFLLIFHQGVTAVATVNLLRYLFILPFMVVAAQKVTHIKIKKYCSQFFLPLCCSLLMGSVIIAVKVLSDQLFLHSAIAVIIFGSALGICVYAISLIFLAPRYLREMHKISRFLPRIGYQLETSVQESVNTMKILLMGPSLGQNGGMAAVQRLILQCGLSQDVQHITTHQEGSMMHRWIIFGTSLYKLISQLLFKKVDLLHLHLSERGSIIRIVIISCIAFVFGKPTFIHAHGAEFEDSFTGLPKILQRGIGLIFRNCAAFIVLSRSCKTYYVSALGLNPDQVNILPNPVQLPTETPIRMDSSPIILAFCGRIGQRKGAFDLIHAFAALPSTLQKQSRLVLVGDGDLEAGHALVIQYRLVEQMCLTGWVDSTTRDQILKQADIFVLPSYNEGLPMAVLEAMAWGLPIITTPVGGIPEIISSGKNGLLIQPGDILGLTHAMQQLIEDCSLRQTLGATARQTVGTFDLNFYGDRLSQIYRSQLAK
jgi:O-antigen/teichoic acid export membrane protein/glycosyltransferase involved in cell wall biosynthesis